MKRRSLTTLIIVALLLVALVGFGSAQQSGTGITTFQANQQFVNQVLSQLGNATKLNGQLINSTAPTAGRFLLYNGTTSQWVATSTNGDIGAASSTGAVTVNHFTLTSNASAGGFKLQSLAVGTVSGDAMAVALNHLNDLAAATGNYAMGGNKLTGLGVNTLTGDVLSQAQSHLNDLATATASYSMGSNRLTSVGAPSVANDALSLGNTGKLVGNGATLDTTVSSPIASGFNVNGVLNPLTFAGSDLGAQINAAQATLPSYSGLAVGTITVPPGSYSHSTTINLSPYVTLWCSPGAILTYTGTTDEIVQQPATGTVSDGLGGVRNCRFNAPASPPVNVTIIHAGNAVGLVYLGNSFNGWSASGDTGILLENTHYFTEHYDIENNFFQTCTNAFELAKNCGTDLNCNASFEHGDFSNNYWGGSYSAVGSFVTLKGGATVSGSNWISNHYNLVYAGDTLFAIDSTSILQANTLEFRGESDASGTYCVSYSGALTAPISSDGLVDCGSPNTGAGALAVGLNQHFIPTRAGYQLSTGATATWYYLGTWTMPNGNATSHVLEIRYRSGNGEVSLIGDSSNNTGAPNVNVSIRQNNQQGAAAPTLLAATFVATGNSTAINNQSWDVWVEFNSYVSGSLEAQTAEGVFAWNITSEAGPPTCPTNVCAQATTTLNEYGVRTFVAGLVNGCAGTVTLAAGAANVNNSCIVASRPVLCTDQTGINAVKCAPSAGSLTIGGTGTDVIAWAQL